ncbi:MAG: response regulator [Saccharofermentans sp.]|jgi:two-component system response regulator YesN|nr:response regulator [Mageeibacillus sp.]MCI1263562.1 response regulator [Saccharofermentans sp.]MCI1274499.1 response regulator [Saccharofermentans sp.]MCI2044788.1 response regulator [Mageeibacillus sp.]
MYKVMLADDEGIVIDSLKFIIEKSFPGQCEIASAKTGRSVIELADSFRPDIAFMDIQMPGINGIEAMREIKNTNSNVVFIVLSAYDKFDYAKEAINLGVLEYINKPFDKNRICEVLKKAMSVVDCEKDKRREELEIKEKLETIMPIIENGLIQSLLSHEHFKEDIDNYMALLGIKEKYAYMVVIVSGQEQVGNYMKGAVPASITIQKNYTEVRLIIEDYFKGIIGTIMGNKLPVMVPYEHDELPYEKRSEIVEQARILSHRLSDKLGINCRIGIGAVRPVEFLSESYSEALAVLVRSSERVAHADDVHVGCEYEENYPLKDEKRLFDAVENGDVVKSTEEASRFFDWLEHGSGGTLSDIRLKALEFVLWSEHLVYSKGGHVYHFLSRSEYLPEVCSIDSLDELRLWFIKHIERSVRIIDSTFEDKSVSAVDQAKNYIDKNYDKDLSLDDISREVDISPYYFSKLFKNKTGVNFIDYLTNIRIEKAKTLLADSDKSMKEICVTVGYSDPNYFSRIFKKVTGVTPTEYKEANCR